MKLIATFEIDDETDLEDVEDLLNVVARDLSALEMRWKVKKDPPS